MGTRKGCSYSSRVAQSLDPLDPLKAGCGGRGGTGDSSVSGVKLEGNCGLDLRIWWDSACMPAK